MSFIRNVLVLTGGTAVAMAVSILASPILTRLYTPGDFGVAVVFGSLSSILLLVSSLRYEAAILLPEDDESAANVLIVCFFIVLLMSLLTGLAIWIAGDFICDITNTRSLQSYLFLLPVSVFGAGTYKVLTHWALRKKDFRRIARTSLIQSSGQVITQLSLGFLGFGPIGLVLGAIIGQVGGSGTLAALAIKQNTATLKKVSLSGMLWAIKRYRRFPLLSAGPALLNGVGLQLPDLMIASLYGTKVAGLFSLSERVLGVPVTLLGTSVAQVFFVETANLAKTDIEKMKQLFCRSLRNMFLLGLPITILVALVTPRFIPIVFGPQWTEAGIYLQSVAFMFLMRLVANAVGGTLDVLERQDIHFLKEVIRITLIIGTLFLAYLFHAGSATAIMLLSAAASAGYGLGVFLCWYAIKRVRSQFNES